MDEDLVVYKVSTPCSSNPPDPVPPGPVDNGPITLSGTARGAKSHGYAVTAGKKVKVKFTLTRNHGVDGSKGVKKEWEDYAVTIGLPGNVTLKGKPKVSGKGAKAPTTMDAATLVWEKVPMRVNKGRKDRPYKRVFSFDVKVNADYAGNLEFTASAFNAVEGYYREAALVVRRKFINLHTFTLPFTNTQKHS